MTKTIETTTKIIIKDVPLDPNNGYEIVRNVEHGKITRIKVWPKFPGDQKKDIRKGGRLINEVFNVTLDIEIYYSKTETTSQ